MTFCPFCGVRADVDLRQIHFRDLGEDASMTCPQCATPLGGIEFETEPPIRIERCTTCHGMFFNPGEIESVLDSQTNPLVWLDPVQIQQIADDFGHQREVFYQKCPMCAERMSHVNFGRRSGVILDRCGKHGIWIEGSKLRRLTEWWRAGGRLIYQENERHKTKLLYGSAPAAKTPGSITSPEEVESNTWSMPVSGMDPLILVDVIASVASMILED